MRRTEFIMLAEAIKAARSFPYTRDGRADNRAIDKVAHSVADALLRHNPAFNAHLFLQNAGVTFPKQTNIG